MYQKDRCGSIYIGHPGFEPHVPDPDKNGTRVQRRAWARKHGKPMPKKDEGEGS